MFESPSAFSIFFKRMVTPGRKADDGWKTVKFQGKFLDHYKMELARRREGMLLRMLQAHAGRCCLSGAEALNSVMWVHRDDSGWCAGDHNKGEAAAAAGGTTHSLTLLLPSVWAGTYTRQQTRVWLTCDCSRGVGQGLDVEECLSTVPGSI